MPDLAPIVAFVRTRDPGGWMSNMSPYPVRYKGQTCRTAEHLFQALRIDLDLAHPAVAEVLTEASPMAAKFKFKALVRDGLQLAVKPWSPADVENMRLTVGLKLDQHPVLQESLAATGHGTLIEDTTRRGRPDTFWGARQVHPDAATVGDDSWEASDSSRWLGSNHLGQIWMRERSSRRLL